MYLPAAPAHLNRLPVRPERVARLRIGLNLSRTHLTGPEICALMRLGKTTIRGIAKERGLTMTRVREVRESGVSGYLLTCEWIEFTCGNKCFDSTIFDEEQRRLNDPPKPQLRDFLTRNLRQPINTTPALQSCTL